MSHKAPFSVDELAAVVQAFEGKTDADFGGGDYAFCEGSTSILSLGLMQGLNIDKMQVVNVNNADGALTYQNFWEENTNILLGGCNLLLHESDHE